MRIKKATQKDLKATAKLFNEYRVFYRKESDLKAAKAFIGERLKNKDSKIFVCEDAKGDLLGFVQLYPLFSSTRMKKLWLLNDLFVHPKHRGKGISIKLINKAKKLVKKTKAAGMFLETEKTNAIGNSLYPRAGFSLNEATNFYDWSVE